MLLHCLQKDIYVRLTMQRQRRKVYFCEEINGPFSYFPLYSTCFNSSHGLHKILFKLERTSRKVFRKSDPFAKLSAHTCDTKAAPEHTHLLASQSVSSGTQHWGQWCYSECCSSCLQLPECCRGPECPALQHYNLPGRSCHICQKLRKS